MLAAPSLLLVAVAVHAEATGSTKQIYQQRTADGRLLLTDRPAPEALTERTWLVAAEDAAAARQRAIDVQQQASVVAERVQRRLIEQERLAVASARSFEPRRESRRYDDDLDSYENYGVPVLVGTPLRYGFDRGSARAHWPQRGEARSGHGHYATRPTAPATLGSR